MAKHMAPGGFKFDVKARAYIYRVLLAAGAVAASYGYITSEEVLVWSGFFATALGTGLATANTSTKEDPDA